MKRNNSVNRQVADMINRLRSVARKYNREVSIKVERQDCNILGRSWWIVMIMNTGYHSSMAAYFYVRAPHRKGHRASFRVAGHRHYGGIVDSRKLEGRHDVSQWWHLSAANG